MPAQPTEQRRSAADIIYEREIEHAVRVLAEREQRALADPNTSTTTGGEYQAMWQRYSSLGTADNGDVF